MRDDYRVIVAGLGGLGSAAAWWLSRAVGADVLGLEQFELGHGRGESHDHSRIIRLTYHTEGYVRLAQAAYKAWHELEAASGERLVVGCGELDLWPADTTLDRSAHARAMTACGVPFELLPAAEVMRRFPQFRLDDDVVGLHQPDGGIVAAMRGVAAHQRMARAQGARLLERARILAVRPTGGEYEVRTTVGTFRAEKLVLAAGPWSARLLRDLGAAPALRVTQEQVTYFASPELDRFGPERFPVWIWMIQANYYGFPTFGAPAVKVAKDRFVPVDPDRRTFAPDPANERMVAEFVARHLPGALGPILETRTCLLTHTPDDDLILDEVPGHPGCVAVVGAAHAYKFASAVGRILAELALGGATPHDLGAFRLDRPALRGGFDRRLPAAE